MLKNITYLNIIFNKNLYIDNDNQSYVRFSYIPNKLLDYADNNYDKMSALIKTENKSNVLVYN